VQNSFCKAGLSEYAQSWSNLAAEREFEYALITACRANDRPCPQLEK
jgi:hypothetical protein